MKKRIIIVLSVTVISIVALVVLIFNIKRGFNVNYEKDMYGFLEKLDAKDKEVIRGELEKYYVERDGYAGFDMDEEHIQYEYEEAVKYKDWNVSAFDYHRDYYKALMVAKRLGDDHAIDVFRDIYANNHHDIESLDIMSYISYVGIMKELGLASDLKKYFDELDNHEVFDNHVTDYSRNGFYLREYIYLLEVFDADMVDEKYHVRQQLDEELAKYSFNTRNYSDKGECSCYFGDMLTIIDMLGVSDQYDFSYMIPYYKEYEKKYYDEDEEAYDYSGDYVEFAYDYYRISGDNSFLSNVEASIFKINGHDFSSIISKAYSNNRYRIYKHPEYDSELKEILDNYVKHLKVDSTHEIRKYDTYYGLKLAQASGFEYDKDKVKEYLKTLFDEYDAEQEYTAYNLMYPVKIANLIGCLDMVPDYYKKMIDDKVSNMDLENYEEWSEYSQILQLKLILDPSYSVSLDQKNRLKEYVTRVPSKLKEKYKGKEELKYVDYIYYDENYMIFQIILGMKTRSDYKEQMKKWMKEEGYNELNFEEANSPYDVFLYYMLAG
ncbi:MAG TPA: hypothetical protein DCX21_03305 [Eubacterium sp.]|nr:hypothetical protein [Eubacterium sp.]